MDQKVVKSHSIKHISEKNRLNDINLSRDAIRNTASLYLRGGDYEYVGEIHQSSLRRKTRS